MWRIGLPFARKRHIFCRQISKTVDFENGALTGINLKKHRVNTRQWWKQNIFRRFWIETGRFLGCRHISLASKSCNESFSVKFPTVFKLCRYRLNASSNFATVTVFTVFKMCRHRVNAIQMENLLTLWQPTDTAYWFDSLLMLILWHPTDSLRGQIAKLRYLYLYCYVFQLK